MVPRGRQCGGPCWEERRSLPWTAARGQTSVRHARTATSSSDALLRLVQPHPGPDGTDDSVHP